MSAFFLKFGFVILAEFLFQTGLCGHCKDVEKGDMTDFNLEKIAGQYELAMGILGDGPVSKLPFNCNGFKFIQHPNPNDGINVAGAFQARDKKTILDTALIHFNSSTDTTGVEIDNYYTSAKKWGNLAMKILASTDDVLVYTGCFTFYGDPENNDFLVLVMRKSDSSLPLSKIKRLLPDSVKNDPKLTVLCEGK